MGKASMRAKINMPPAPQDNNIDGNNDFESSEGFLPMLGGCLVCGDWIEVSDREGAAALTGKLVGDCRISARHGKDRLRFLCFFCETAAQTIRERDGSCDLAILKLARRRHEMADERDWVSADIERGRRDDGLSLEGALQAALARRRNECEPGWDNNDPDIVALYDKISCEIRSIDRRR